MTTWEALNRFVVAHGSCRGEVAFSELHERDLVVDDPAGLAAWITARCGGCGTSTRELVLLEEMFGGFAKLVADAGVDIESLLTAIRQGDDKAAAALAEQVRQSPAMLRVALQGIRKALTEENRN
jgi:hypothetical protein